MKNDYNKCSTETLGYRFFVNVNFYLIIWTFNTIVKIIKFDRSKQRRGRKLLITESDFLNICQSLLRFIVNQ